MNVTKILLDTENPFRWNVRNDLKNIPDDMISRLADQISEKVFNPEFLSECIMVYATLCHEYCLKSKLDDALRTIQTAENKLHEIISTTEEFKILPALTHIIMATKAHALKLKNNQSAVDVVFKIPKISELNASNQSALVGLQSMYYSEYGIDGTKMALELSNKAIDLDECESLWHFLKGKYIGRIRRAEKPYDIPTAEEISALEKSMEFSQNPSYIVFTAQVYRESANRVYRAYNMNKAVYASIRHEIDTLNRHSFELYKKSIKLKPDCSHMAFRCAKGLIMLPEPYRDEQHAKKLLETGLISAPMSAYGNHVMAQYYERIVKDPLSAIKHLKICQEKQVFGAVMDLIRLEYRLDRNARKTASALEKAVNDFKDTSRQCHLLSQLLSLHIFAIPDLVKACEFAEKIMRMNASCVDMLRHRPITVLSQNTINLYDLLIDELKICLQNEACPSTDREIFVTFLSDIELLKICYVRSKKPQYLKDSIINCGYSRQPKMFDTRQRSESNYLTHFRVGKKIGNPVNISKNNVNLSMKKLNDACKELLTVNLEKTQTVESKVKTNFPEIQKSENDNEPTESEDDFNEVAKRVYQKTKKDCMQNKSCFINERKYESSINYYDADRRRDCDRNFGSNGNEREFSDCSNTSKKQYGDKKNRMKETYHSQINKKKSLGFDDESSGKMQYSLRNKTLKYLDRKHEKKYSSDENKMYKKKYNSKRESRIYSKKDESDQSEDSSYSSHKSTKSRRRKDERIHLKFTRRHQHNLGESEGRSDERGHKDSGSDYRKPYREQQSVNNDRKYHAEKKSRSESVSSSNENKYNSRRYRKKNRDIPKSKRENRRHRNRCSESTSDADDVKQTVELFDCKLDDIGRLARRHRESKKNRNIDSCSYSKGEHRFETYESHSRYSSD